MMRFYFCLLLVSMTSAQVPLLGGCPKVETMQNFEPERYLGKWYEAERYFAIFEFGGKCVTAEYSLLSNGTIKVVNSQISALSGIASSIEGTARTIMPNSSKLLVNFPSLPIQFDAPYWILYTDYDTFSVVWSCNDFGLFSVRNAWILTRERNPPVSVLENAYQILDKNGISRAFFIRTDQKNCPKDT